MLLPTIDQLKHLLLGSGALLADAGNVGARDLVERGHVQRHALRQATLVRGAERGTGAGDALGEALGVSFNSGREAAVMPLRQSCLPARRCCTAAEKLSPTSSRCRAIISMRAAALIATHVLGDLVDELLGAGNSELLLDLLLELLLLLLGGWASALFGAAAGAPTAPDFFTPPAWRRALMAPGLGPASAPVCDTHWWQSRWIRRETTWC